MRRPREVDPHQDWPTMLQPENEDTRYYIALRPDAQVEELGRLRDRLDQAEGARQVAEMETAQMQRERDEARDQLLMANADAAAWEDAVIRLESVRDDLGIVSLPVLPDSVRHDLDPGEFPDMPPLVEEGKWEPSLPPLDLDEWEKRYANGEWPWVLPQRVPGEALAEER
jgi:hypothetical protein